MATMKRDKAHAHAMDVGALEPEASAGRLAEVADFFSPLSRDRKPVEGLQISTVMIRWLNSDDLSISAYAPSLVHCLLPAVVPTQCYSRLRLLITGTSHKMHGWNKLTYYLDLSSPSPPAAFLLFRSSPVRPRPCLYGRGPYSCSRSFWLPNKERWFTHRFTGKWHIEAYFIGRLQGSFPVLLRNVTCRHIRIDLLHNFIGLEYC